MYHDVQIFYYKVCYVPFWSLIYLLLLLLSAVFTIVISPSKTPFYILAELSSGLFAIMFFLFYYGVVPYPAHIATPLLMLGFILFQEIWVNRDLYNLISLQNVPEEEQKSMLFVVPLVTILFLSPFIWVVLQVFRHYVQAPPF